jgi:hypothetical protein
MTTNVELASDIVVVHAYDAASRRHYLDAAKKPSVVQFDKMEVELVLRGSLHPGEKIEVGRHLSIFDAAFEPKVDVDTRTIIFLNHDGPHLCYIARDAAVWITTGLHRTRPTLSSNIADDIVNLALTPGEGYSDSHFALWSAIGLSITWNRSGRAFNRARELLKSDNWETRMNACLAMNKLFDVGESCLALYVDKDQPDELKGPTISSVKSDIPGRKDRLIKEFQDLGDPAVLNSLDPVELGRKRERMDILALYSEDRDIRKLAASVVKKLKDR